MFNDNILYVRAVWQILFYIEQPIQFQLDSNSLPYLIARCVFEAVFAHNFISVYFW